MCKSSWVLLLITIIAGVVGFGGYAATYATAWKGLFALFLVLSLVSCGIEYRERSSH